MKVSKGYQTKDGQFFTDKEAARIHEQKKVSGELIRRMRAAYANSPYEIDGAFLRRVVTNADLLIKLLRPYVGLAKRRREAIELNQATAKQVTAVNEEAAVAGNGLASL